MILVFKCQISSQNKLCQYLKFNLNKTNPWQIVQYEIIQSKLKLFGNIDSDIVHNYLTWRGANISLLSHTHNDGILKGSVWDRNTLVLNDSRIYTDYDALIFSVKFVFSSDHKRKFLQRHRMLGYPGSCFVMQRQEKMEQWWLLLIPLRMEKDVHISLRIM